MAICRILVCYFHQCSRWLKKWLSAVFCWFWSAILRCFGYPIADTNDESYSVTDRDLEAQEAVKGDHDLVQLPTGEEEEDDGEAEEEVHFIPDSDRDFRVPKQRTRAIRQSSSVAKSTIPGGIKPRPRSPRR